VGGVCLALKCADAEVLNRLQSHYREFLTDGAADILIELEGVERLSPDEVKAALSQTAFRHQNNSFTTTSLILSGSYDLDQGIIRIRGERNLASPDLGLNYFNQLISLAYYSACKVKYDGRPPALLVHSCAIVRQGRALLFTGPCDAGKTTIARLCGHKYGQVLNDEMVLVSRPDQADRTPGVQGVPVIGEFTTGVNRAAPLGCLLFLKQSKRTLLRRIDRTEAYVRFLRQIVAPAYIGQKDRRAVFSLMAQFSEEVTGRVPAYELEFTLDRERLWQVVGQLETTLEGD